MKTASESLTPAQRQRIEQAIAEAERKTSAEIVVVVATRSGRYDRAEDTFGVLLALLSVALAWLFYQDLHPSSADWVAGHELTLGLIPVLLLFLLWWLVGLGLATRFPILARPFVPRQQYEAEVRRRGFEAFHLFRVTSTQSRTGVLIFVSLLERQALVSGDERINAALPADTWQGATRVIADAARRNQHDDGIVQAINLIALPLADKFPKDPNDRDELPNTVHLLD